MHGATAASVRVLVEPPPSPGGASRRRRVTLSPAASGSWRDLRLRLISAAVLVPLGLACMINGGWIFAALVMLAMVGLCVEWAGMMRTRLQTVPGLVMLVLPGIALLAAIRVDFLSGLRVLLAGWLLGPWRGAGLVLAGCGGFALIWLRGMTGTGPVSLLFVLLVVWSSDSCAYLAGRSFGGRKLAPRISPGKTWSGAIGGLLGAMLAGALVAAAPVGGAPTPTLAVRILQGVAFGGLLGIAAQAGDLAESALKRRCGVKDSGRLIPGHGGLLDRLDGLLAAAPLAALLSLGCAPGQPFWQFDPLDLQKIDLGARHLAPGWLEGVIATSIAAMSRDQQR